MQAASLGGLSPEEAMLIADVMSRLTGTITLQEQVPLPPPPAPAATSNIAAVDNHLQQLSQQEQAIERELKDMARTSWSSPHNRVRTSSASSPAASSAPSNTGTTVSSYGRAAHQLLAAGGASQPVAAGSAGGSLHERQGGAFGSSGSSNALSATVVQVSGGGVSTTTAESPIPARAITLLQEMREQLRQSQHLAASIAAPPGDASGLGEETATTQDYHALAASVSNGRRQPVLEPAGIFDLPQDHRGLALAPVNQRLQRASAPDPGPAAGLRGARAAHAAASTGRAPGASPSAALLHKQPFILPSPKQVSQQVAAAYAAANADGSSPTKPRVRLPEDERSARLQQLYDRTVQWRKRCEERYSKERQEQEASALDGCTFAPTINVASAIMAQGIPPAAAYAEAAKAAATPLRAATRPAGSHTPVSRGAAGAATPAASPFKPPASTTPTAARAGSARDSRGPSSPGPSSGTTPSKAVAVDGAAVGSRLYTKASEYRLRHEERVLRALIEEAQHRQFTARVQDVTPRLYKARSPATKHLPSGMDECTFHPRTRYKVMSTSRAFEEGDLPRVRNGGSASGAAADVRRSASATASSRPPASRAKSAPHMRAGSAVYAAAPGSNGADASPSSLNFDNIVAAGLHGRRGSSSAQVGAAAAAAAAGAPLGGGPHGVAASVTSHALSFGSGAGGPRRRSGAGVGAGPASTIAPELDWDEFIMRQQHFLVEREVKVQLLKQVGSPAPAMSAGSRKLILQKASRSRAHSGDGQGSLGESSGGGAAAALAAAAAGVRKTRAIMEMYGECTFQPQITRKAAQLPARPLHDMVDGGRSRREEWMEQQRALKQVQEAEGATFRPESYTKDAYAYVKPRISLRNPDQYLEQHAQRKRQQDAARQELLQEREALEMQHCTFRPQTTPLPAYLIRQLQQEYYEQQQQEELQAMLAEEQAYFGEAPAQEQYEQYDGVDADGAYGHQYAGYAEAYAAAAAGQEAP